MAGVIEGVIGVIGGVIGVIEGGRISHCFRAIHSCYKLYHHRQRHFGLAVHTCRIKTARGSVYFVAITAFVRPGRSAVLFRCARPACIDAAFVNAVLATYGSPDAVPAANVVPAEAQRVRAMFSMS